MCAYFLSCLSKNWYFEAGEACLCGHLCVASLLYGFVLPILEYCGLLLNVMFSLLYKVNSSSNHCLFIELPSASVRVRHTQAAAAAHPLEFEVSRY